MAQTPEEKKQSQKLQARNKAVQAAYLTATQNMKPLVEPFANQKYRTFLNVDHSKSGRDTNLISEFLCCFFNVTLTKNKVGFLMIYFTYDAEALTKFGPRLYNRALRQLFKDTTSESKEIEDCIRINSNANVQGFFVNRLASGENDFTTIDIIDHLN